MLGTRGVPANYGGFETCVEEVGKRLVNKGHHVTVYCRSGYYDEPMKSYLGMKRVSLPSIHAKSLDTLSHTFLSTLHAMWSKYDVFMVFNAANSVFSFPLRMLGKKIAVNTDGLEWKRSKWGWAGRTYYKISEKLACMVANRLVSDSKGIKTYYQDTHNIASTHIAYGAPIQHTTSTNIIQKLGLHPGDYFLQITRFEPENHPLLTIKAFKKLTTNKKMVLIGCNPYPNGYSSEIEKEKNDRILLPGCIYDQETLKQLWCNSFAYIHGNAVGGTNPALLQTMASGCFTIASDNPFNRDVLADCGIYYKCNEEALAASMQWALENNHKLNPYRQRATQRIIDYYSWDHITDQYEALFFDLHFGKYKWHFPFQTLFGKKWGKIVTSTHRS